jgi:hypothetical protein
MTIIAIIVGCVPPKLSDIPYGCWAEKRADGEAWAIISTFGATAAVTVTDGAVTNCFNEFPGPYSKGDKITVGVGDERS